MSDPTLLTTVTSDVAQAKTNPLSNVNKSSTLLWLLVIVLVVAVIFLYMWRRGDRLMLLATRQQQMNCITMDQCTALIEESILEYDKQQHQIVQHVDETTTKPSPLPDNQEACDEEDEDEDEDEDILSLEEDSTSSEEDEQPETQNNDEDEDEYDRVMSNTPSPPK